MAVPQTIEIEVVFAAPERQEIRKLTLPVNSTVNTAVNLSELQSLFPQYSLKDCSVGIYGKIVSRDYILSNADRVEIYRPLNQSPTDARRNRAKSSK